MTIRKVRRGNVEIAYETLGPATGEPLLLVMGTGGQLVSWHPDFCAELVERGFQVVRFDNRDAGLSSHFTSAGPPNQLKMWLRPAAAAAYDLDDMADDAIAVLDANEWPSAHLLGVSQGGMIAQAIATRYPDRARTLTSISSAPAPRIGQIRLGTLLKLAAIAKKRVNTADEFAQQQVELTAITGSPAYPTDEIWFKEASKVAYEHGYDLASVQRQTAAIAASGDRRTQLAKVRVPTLVIHGEADQMVQLAGGKATAAAIPGARLVTFPGMGHDLPRELWPAILGHVRELVELSPEARFWAS